MIEISTSNQTERIIKKIDKNKTMLIIGTSYNFFNAGKIEYYDTTEKVKNDYGEGDLVNAFETAKLLGAPHIFILNLASKFDFIDAIDVIKQYEFSYIVPINILLSDYFYDKNRNNQKITFIQDYLERGSRFNRSILICTDKHASLYEDIDSFLNEMKDYTTHLETKITTKVAGRNLLFVANNLKNYPYSNIILASILVSSDIAEYPSFKNEPVIFDIDAFDIKEERMAYFKRTYLNGTTIENMVSFEREHPMLISIYTYRMIRFLEQIIDLSEFHGKLNRAYQKVKIERKLEQILDGMIGWIIYDYKIQKIQCIEENAGEDVYLTDIDLWLMGTSEKFTLKVGE